MTGYLRIGEFSERVGVSPDLLRAWERRYGLLRPDRSQGGFRLYSDADAARVGLMRDHLDAGLSAAEAARLALSGLATTRPAPPVDDLSPGLGLDRLGAALETFDETGAHEVLDQLLASFRLETVLREVVVPCLARIGQRWRTGELTVGQEHFASGLLRGRLLAVAQGWGAGVGPVAVLAAPPGEEHDLALVVFGLALWRRGWRITFLGADTPTAAIADTVRSVGADLLVLAAVQPDPLVAAADELAPLSAEARVVVGGAGASADLATALGAEHLDADPVTAAEGLLPSR